MPSHSSCAVVACLFANCILAAAGAAQGHLYTVYGSAPGESLGASLDGVGDVDRDGHADFIVGAPDDPYSSSAAGTARVYSGADGRVLFTFPGTAGQALGYSVAGAGDVDNDGFPDVIVGAPGIDTAFVFSGRDGRRLHALAGGVRREFFGGSVDGAGDVDRDGHADLIVGALVAAKGEPRVGRALVLSGRDGRILHTFWGSARDDAFGGSVSAAGDVDNDGHADVIVGASQFSPFTGSNGYAQVFSGKDGAALHTFLGASLAGRAGFGESVSGAGDVDLDGYDDLIVGAPESWMGQGFGYAEVLSGRDGRLLHRFVGDERGDGTGRSVDGCGDVDRDGVPDLIVNLANDARVFSGRDGKLLASFRGWGTLIVSGAGDVNGDACPDFMVGNARDYTNGVASGSATVASFKALALSTDTHLVSVAKGGSQTFRIDAGPAHAGEIYLLAGTASGTAPGIPLGPGLRLPLNHDPYFELTLFEPSPLLGNSLARLDATGRGTARFTIPPLPIPSLVGLRLHHAYVVVTPAPLRFHLVSNPVPLTFE